VNGSLAQPRLPQGLENYTLLTRRIIVEKFNDHEVFEKSSLATFSNARSPQG
jgi:hypothetical protein